MQSKTVSVKAATISHMIDSMQTTAERVERATLPELRDVHIDDVYVSGCRIVAAPDRRYAIAPEDTPPNLLINPYEVRTFSLISLTKRLRTLGLSTQACDEISKRGNLYYENAWNEYEDIPGEEHPRRYFDRLAPASI